VCVCVCACACVRVCACACVQTLLLHLFLCKYSVQDGSPLNSLLASLRTDSSLSFVFKSMYSYINIIYGMLWQVPGAKSTNFKIEVRCKLRYNTTITQV